MRLFISGLADTLVEFQRTPLDDRDPHWVMRYLKLRLTEETLRQNLPVGHRRSIVELFQRLDWYCLVRDLQIEYPECGS
jgi:hypothetical protein